MKLCGFETGNRNPFFLIAGPCVIESREMVMEIASFMKETCDELGIRYIFKASFDKANRTSTKSYRGPGIDEGLKILDDVRREVSVPILTDVHTPEQVRQVAVRPTSSSLVPRAASPSTSRRGSSLRRTTWST